jgi:Flp pilus assembly protein TadD
MKARAAAAKKNTVPAASAAPASVPIPAPAPFYSDDDTNHLKLLIAKLMKEDDPEGAGPVARLLISVRPDDPDAWFLHGCVEEDRGDLDSAKKSFYRALELGGREAQVSFHLSTIHMLQGNFVQAIAGCRRALKAAPRDAQIHLRLAVETVN